MHPNRLLIALVLIGSTLGLALGALGSLARAQDAPPVAPGPQERVLFAPNLGILRRPAPGTRQGSVPGDLEGDLARQAGLRVQNTGDRPTRVLAFFFNEWKLQEEPDDAWVPSPSATPGSRPLAPDQPAAWNQPAVPNQPTPEPGCDTCGSLVDCGECGGLFNAVCSPPIAPGASWTFPLRRTDAFRPTDYPTRTVAAVAVAYSLNHRPAKDYGPVWEARAEAAGLEPSASVADVVCHDAERAIRHPETIKPDNRMQQVQCGFYRGFHAAYLTGEPMVPEEPFDPVRGEPIAGVAAVPMPSVNGNAPRPGETPSPWSYNRLALDRYAAVPLSETGFGAGSSQPKTFTSYVPGVYTTTPEGQQSVVFVQNAGTECATVRFDALRNGGGPVVQGRTVELPIGSWLGFSAQQTWPELRGSITVRAQSNQPIALAATTLGYLTSGTFTGLRERAAPVAWAVPLAYQAPRPIPWLRGRAGEAGRGASVVAVDGMEALDAAAGWETNVAIVNPAEEPNMVRMETQAAGQPARDASYPIEPLSQILLQLGLGLGLTGGGEGWGRLSSGELPLAISLESFRVASDVPAATEAWTTTAWPYDPSFTVHGPRAVALPDLGGPAVGGIDPGLLITRTATMTDALAGRILVQNLGGEPARVAIDSFAPDGGYMGGVGRKINAYQTVSVPLAQLPGTRWGANAAMVRVLEGEVAAMFEMRRAEQVAVDDAPPDHTSAYVGVAREGGQAPPTPRGGPVYLPALRNGEPEEG